MKFKAVKDIKFLFLLSILVLLSVFSVFRFGKISADTLTVALPSITPPLPQPIFACLDSDQTCCSYYKAKLQPGYNFHINFGNLTYNVVSAATSSICAAGSIPIPDGSFGGSFLSAGGYLDTPPINWVDDISKYYASANFSNYSNVQNNPVRLCAQPKDIWGSSHLTWKTTAHPSNTNPVTYFTDKYGLSCDWTEWANSASAGALADFEAICGRCESVSENDIFTDNEFGLRTYMYPITLQDSVEGYNNFCAETSVNCEKTENISITGPISCSFTSVSNPSDSCTVSSSSCSKTGAATCSGNTCSIKGSNVTKICTASINTGTAAIHITIQPKCFAYVSRGVFYNINKQPNHSIVSYTPYTPSTNGITDCAGADQCWCKSSGSAIYQAFEGYFLPMAFVGDTSPMSATTLPSLSSTYNIIVEGCTPLSAVCSGPTTAVAGVPANFNVIVQGGNAPYVSPAWSSSVGGDSPSATTNNSPNFSSVYTFAAAGARTISFSVLDSTTPIPQSATASCSLTTVYSQPTVTCTPSASTINSGGQVTFTATSPSGGSGGYTYNWSGTGTVVSGCGTASTTCVKSFTTSGTVPLYITDSQGNQSPTSFCDVTVGSAPFATCVGPSSVTLNAPATYNVTVAGGLPPYLNPIWSSTIGGTGSGASATATLTSGKVNTIAINSGGSGYTTVPTVLFSGGGIGYATAVVNISGGSVYSINITTGGSGYTVAPTVTIAAPPSGTTATATAVVSGGVVISVNVTNGGSGYTSAPTVSFSGGGIAYAIGTASISAGQVSSISVAAPGSRGQGYISAPTITIVSDVPAVTNNSPNFSALYSFYGPGTRTISFSAIDSSPTPQPVSAVCPATMVSSNLSVSCQPTQCDYGTGAIVTFTASAGPPGSTYSWTTNDAAGSPNTCTAGGSNSSTCSEAFSTAGTKIATVTETYNGISSSANCAAQVSTTSVASPLDVSCFQYNNPYQKPTGSGTYNNAFPFFWAPTNGNFPSYAFSWTSPNSGVCNLSACAMSGSAAPGHNACKNTTDFVCSGSVNVITVTNGGLGYVLPPAVSITAAPAGGTTAVASANLTAGAVSSITITNNGAGYITTPTVTIAAPPCTIDGITCIQATATASSGSVTIINILTPGSGYTATPTVTIGAPPCTTNGTTCIQALAAATTANFSGTWEVANINVSQPGAGYTTAPTVTITGGNGSGATASSSTLPVNSCIYKYDNNTQCNLKCYKDYWCGGFPNNFSGSGYTSVPTVSFSGGGGGTGAAATATLGVSLISVTSAGSGYTSAPPVVFSGGGGGTGAAATAVYSAGTVSGINVTSLGTGYTTPPTVSLTGNGCTSNCATAVAKLGVSSFSVTNAGSGYTLTPSVTLTGGGCTTNCATAMAVLSGATVGSVTVGGAYSEQISVTTPSSSSFYPNSQTATATCPFTMVASASDNNDLQIECSTVPYPTTFTATTAFPAYPPVFKSYYLPVGQPTYFVATSQKLNIGNCTGCTYSWSGVACMGSNGQSGELTGATVFTKVKNYCEATASSGVNKAVVTVYDPSFGASYSATCSAFGNDNAYCLNNYCGVYDAGGTNPINSITVGSTVVFKAVPSAGSGNYTYVWSGLPTGTATVTGCDSSGNNCHSGCSAAPNAECKISNSTVDYGTVTVKVTDTTSNINETSNCSVNVAAPITVTCSPATVFLVPGSQAIFTASGTAGGFPPYTYNWSGPGTVIDRCGPSNDKCFKSFTSSGIIPLYVTDTQGNQSPVSFCQVTVVLSPIAVCSGPTTAIVGNPVNFNVNVQGGISPYVSPAWSSSVGGDIAGATISNSPNFSSIYTFPAAGTRTISFSGSDSSTPTPQPVSAVCPPTVVYDKPTVTCSPSTSAIDSSGTVTFTATGSSGGVPGAYTYNWSGPGTTQSGCTTSSLSCVKKFTSSGSIALNIKDSKNNQSATSFCQVAINPDLQLTCASGNPASVVLGGSATFTANAGSGTAPYTFNNNWTESPAGDTKTGSGNNSVSTWATYHFSTSTGAKNLTTSVTDAGGQTKSVTCSTSVVYPPPFISGSCQASPSTINSGGSTTFSPAPGSVSGGNGTYTYHWGGDCVATVTDPTKTCSSTYTNGGATALTKTSSLYVTSVGVNSNPPVNCSVVVNPSPVTVAGCVGNPYPSYTNATATFSPFGVSGGTGAYSYAWTNGCVLPDSPANANCITSFPSAGTYTANLQVTDTGNGSFATTACILPVLANFPTVTLNAPGPDYCHYGAGNGSVNFSWIYSPAGSGLPQSKVQFQAATDSGFGTILVDETNNSTSPGQLINVTIACNSAQCSCTDGSCSYNLNPCTPCLDYNKNYYWRVKVYNANGDSGWMYYNSSGGTATMPGTAFHTSTYPYPAPAFSILPASPFVGQQVNFVDNSYCYPLGIYSRCGSLQVYTWLYSGHTSHYPGSIYAVFDTKGSKPVVLSICDGANCCSASHSVPVRQSTYNTCTHAGTCMPALGNYASQCQTDCDCNPGGPGCTTVTYYSCDLLNQQCIPVPWLSGNDPLCPTGAGACNIPSTYHGCRNQACVPLPKINPSDTDECNISNGDADCIIPVYHYVCDPGNQCVAVMGAGDNQGGCTSAGDTCSTPPTSHFACNPGGQCVTVLGTGSNEGGCISSGVPCPTPPPSNHYECDTTQQCISVLGNGSNQGGCTSAGGSCPNPPHSPHNECNASSQCISVQGSGGNTCDTLGAPCSLHTACHSEQCLNYSGGGPNTCSTNAECMGMHNICSADHLCITASGAGTNTCSFDSECAPSTPAHKECDTLGKCISVQGPVAASDTCGVDTDCNPACTGSAVAPTPTPYSSNYFNTTNFNSVTFSTIHNVCSSSSTATTSLSCITVEGPGSDQCNNDQSCSGGVHRICNINNQCVLSAGLGICGDQCNKDCGPGNPIWKEISPYGL